MIDPVEIEAWRVAYIEESLKLGAPEREAAEWARSMSLIADELTDSNDGVDEVDA